MSKQTPELIELNIRAELDKPKLVILGSDLDEVSLGFKFKTGADDGRAVMDDLHHLAGKRLNIRLLECVVDDDSQMDLFPNRFANLDRARLIMAVEEFEAVGRRVQRIAFEATATETTYAIPIMDIEELLTEVEGALSMTGADQFKRPNPDPIPETRCLYRRLESGGVEGKSFDNELATLTAAYGDGWTIDHPDHLDAETDAPDAQEPHTATQEPSDAAGAPPADELYEAAKALIVEAQAASVSMLQRKYKIGYNRAARLMNDLRDGGVVGPAIPGKAPEVLIAPAGEPA